jgi:hypothetical protein
VNPDTEQVGYHAQSVTKEQLARAEALVRRLCPDPDPVLQALGLIPAPARKPPPAPDGVEVCKRGHVRTPGNTRVRLRGGYRCRECLDCAKERNPPDPGTHCRNGHEWTPDNTTWDDKGGRRCRACRNAANRAAYQRRKAKRQREREARQEAQ